MYNSQLQPGCVACWLFPEEYPSASLAFIPTHPFLVSSTFPYLNIYVLLSYYTTLLLSPNYYWFFHWFSYWTCLQFLLGGVHV